jgi:hypothetical protein
MRDQLLCQMAALALRYGAGGILLPIGLGIATFVIALAVRRALGRAPKGEGSPTNGPHWVMASWICAALYASARIVDPLLHARQVRPESVEPDAWARIGYFEWRLFGGEILRLLLPLRDQPGVGLAVHAVFWGLLFWLLSFLLSRFGARLFTRARTLHFEQPEDDLPFYFRWTGASTARRADARTKRKLTLPLTLLVLAHLAVGGLLVASAPHAGTSTLTCGGEDAGLETAPLDHALDALPPPLPIPSAGAYILAGLCLAVFGAHLVAEGRPRATPEAKKERESNDAPSEARGTVERFADALSARGITIADWREREEAGSEGERAPPPAGVHPLFSDVLERLVGEGSKLHRHQADVLTHLTSAWHAERAHTRGPAPQLEEEVLGATFIEKSSHSHPLVILPEGAGRTTLGLCAALLVVLDRGATAIVVSRHREGARALGAQLRSALERSALRWNVHLAIAGDDLGGQLAAGRVPHLVFADLESLEAEILGDARTDALLSRLGLLVIDDLDAFVGVPEMHLHVAMRRFWALCRTVRDAPYPLLLLALAGPSAEGMVPWARHLLAAPLLPFETDTAPRRALIHVRRRDLIVDPAAYRSERAPDPTVAELAAAAGDAGLSFHLRLSGDEHRAVLRASIDLESLPGHVADPARADVVILEGRHPEVAREARRLVHAGIRREGEVLIIHAPPPDEDTILFDAAIDAPERALTASLPRAVSLALPALVLQRHFDRALGREHEVEALRERFGRRFVDETLGALERRGLIAERTVWQFDPRTDDAVAQRRVRSVNEASLGEPIAESTVGDSRTRVALLDEGTTERLGEVDGSIASARFPPGTFLLLPSGRYQVRGESDHTGRRAIALVHGRPPLRASVLRKVHAQAHGPLDWSERTLSRAGGTPVQLCTARLEITETLSGVRIFLPGATLLERRRYDRELASTYFTEACVANVDALAAAGEAPLITAVRRALPLLIRGAEGALDVEIDRLDGRRCLILFDRTPGGSGLSRAIEGELLGDLLRVARRILERLVEDQVTRMRALFDSRAVGDAQWDSAAALTFLDRTLDGARTISSALTFGYAPGEGNPGDLGRLWVAPSGRTDDLIWVRHPFLLDEAIGAAPAGEVALDVGVERIELRRTSEEDDARLFGAVRALLEKIAGSDHGADELALRWVAGLPLSRAVTGDAARAALLQRRADGAGRIALLEKLAPTLSADGEGRVKITRQDRVIDVDLRAARARVRSRATG